MDNTFDPSFTSNSKSDEDHSKLQSLCLQTEKKNKASLSISAADFITWDGKSDNNMESGLRNAINSDANIPSIARSAMFDQKSDCHQVNIIGNFNNYNVACAMPRGQSLQPINAKTQEMSSRRKRMFLNRPCVEGRVSDEIWINSPLDLLDNDYQEHAMDNVYQFTQHTTEAHKFLQMRSAVSRENYAQKIYLSHQV
ncbi:RxLR effector protein [Trichinella spiralis]|uniref:RxLR effector protein n=1 Tax=Trichinella spiralis TaxID=6334 RepID=A0ABR3KKS7_TRISP